MVILALLKRSGRVCTPVRPTSTTSKITEVENVVLKKSIAYLISLGGLWILKVGALYTVAGSSRGHQLPVSRWERSTIPSKGPKYISEESVGVPGKALW